MRFTHQANYRYSYPYDERPIAWLPDDDTYIGDDNDGDPVNTSKLLMQEQTTTDKVQSIRISGSQKPQSMASLSSTSTVAQSSAEEDQAFIRPFLELDNQAKLFEEMQM